MDDMPFVHGPRFLRRMDDPHDWNVDVARTVLITGASGLLGRAVLQAFVDEGWNAVGLAYSRAHLSPNLLKVDICDHSAVSDVLIKIKVSSCLLHPTGDLLVYCGDTIA